MMPSMNRALRNLGWVLLACFGAAPQAQAQAMAVGNWPNGQTVRVIVPFPGGASTLDSVVRIVTPEFAKALGTAVIVDNKPGAGTVIGVDATAKSTDGHTVGGLRTVSPSIKAW